MVEESIYCKQCYGLLEPNVVLYGDSIPRYYDALDLIGAAEELLVVGTSFYTSTASDFVGIAKRAGIKITIINDDAERNKLFPLINLADSNRICLLTLQKLHCLRVL